jgi:aminopeptidase N
MTINAGDMVTATVFYHGHPFHESWGGFHWSGEYCFNLGVGFVSIPHNLGKTWFPCIDDFQDRAVYDLYVEIEEGKDAVCGGMLESITNNGDGTQTYHWSLGQTIPTYLASVAVGDYARWTDTYTGILQEVPIEIWVKPGDSTKVDAAFAKLNQILAIFEEAYGPYRWDRVGYVGTSIGAMEHVCNIAYPHFSIGPGIGNESLYAHELSHMWFGDNVTCSSAEEMWLNEGWAVFSEALYREIIYGKESYREYLREMHADVIQFCHTPGKDGSYFPLNQIPQNVTYGMSAYDRGATVAHSLRGYLGDNIFFEAMAEYNEFFKYNHASSYDLRDFITDHTGILVSDWFDNWVFNSGTPHYSVDSFTVIPNGNDFDVTVYMKQKRHGPSFTGNSNKIELTFMDDSWNQHDETVFFDGATGMQTFVVPFEPDIIIPDFHENQSDAITDHKQTIKEAGNVNFTKTYLELQVESVGDSAFVYVGHQWAPPDPLKTPVQGLTLSDYRYWIVDGIMPEGFNATGVFWYNRNTYLDDGIITSAADSVVIMYRPSPAYDWQFIDFTKIGLWNIGKLYVDNLQKGEYTIAVADETFVGVKQQKKGKGLHVYPNPGEREFIIGVDQPGNLLFYDVTGNLLDNLRVQKHQQTVVWNPGRLNEGTYFVRFNSENNVVLGVERIVVLKN